VGGALSVVPFVRGAVLGYAFDEGRDPLVNGWALGGLSLSTALSRRFGGVRHALEPRLDWRLGGGVLGRALPAFGYDQWDRAPAVPPGAAVTFRAATGASRLAAAAPPGPFHQVRLSLATRLSSGEKELFRAEVGQDLELRRGRLAEGYVTAAAARGLVSGEAELRFWTGGRLEPGPRTPPGSGSWLDAFSQARLRLAVSDARGDAVRLGLLSFGPGGSGQQQAGADSLFDPRAVDVGTFVPPEPGTPGSTWSLASATLGAQVRLGPATIGYEAQLPVRTAIVPACSGAEGAVRTIGPWLVRQHTGSLEWDSPCRCFRARASIRYSDCGGVGGGFTLDLGAAASP
jgi:LPS-assembly protein